MGTEEANVYRGPYSGDLETIRCMNAAVAVERERCAKIAFDFMEQYVNLKLAKMIASAIRKPTS